MKRTLLLQIFFGTLLMVVCSINANASAIMSISVGAVTVTCDNSQAFSATNCSAVVGFNTIANSDTITFTGSVAGYSLGDVGVDGISLTSNNPGTASFAQVAQTLTQVIHNSGADILQIDFGVNNFTLPTGLGTLSAVHSGTMTNGTAGTETFLGWERNDNTLSLGPGGATAVSMTNPCTFAAAAPPVQGCNGPTSTIGSPNVGAPFSITGRTMINTSIGSQTQWTNTIALTAVTQVPEPNTLVLLVTGMLMVGGAGIRYRK